MKDTNEFPKTLQAAIKHFADADTALQFMVSIRWPHGVKCPRCGSEKVSFTASRRVWTCECCPKRRQFSIKVGTIMEDSPIALGNWLVGTWLIVSAKNGISSYELHRTLGLTQKSAWFLGHRIRLALQNGTFEKLSAEIEADESYLGRKVRNMHADKKRKRGRGTGGVGKVIIMGLLERRKDDKSSTVKLKHVPNARRSTVQGEIRQHVADGSHVFTDALPSYNGLNSDYVHETIDHAREYVRGNVHTNGLENFWCLLKRSIRGTYVSVDQPHLFRYLDEQAYRFNERETTDSERFLKAVPSIIGRRLTYKGLTGNVGLG